MLVEDLEDLIRPAADHRRPHRVQDVGAQRPLAAAAARLAHVLKDLLLHPLERLDRGGVDVHGRGGLSQEEAAAGYRRRPVRRRGDGGGVAGDAGAEGAALPPAEELHLPQDPARQVAAQAAQAGPVALGRGPPQARDAGAAPAPPPVRLARRLGAGGGRRKHEGRGGAGRRGRRAAGGGRLGLLGLEVLEAVEVPLLAVRGLLRLHGVAADDGRHPGLELVVEERRSEVQLGQEDLRRRAGGEARGGGAGGLR